MASMVDRRKLTRTQKEMVDLLSDGQPHSSAELKECLWDELADVNTVQFHISTLRKFLRPIGEDVICENVRHGVLKYRHVRLIGSSARGSSG